MCLDWWDDAPVSFGRSVVSVEILIGDALHAGRVASARLGASRVASS